MRLLLDRGSWGVVAALTLLTVTGCGGGGGSTDPVMSATAKSPQGLTVQLRENAATVSSQSPLTYTASITNDTKNPIRILLFLPANSNKAEFPTVLFRITDIQGTSVYTSPQGGAGSPGENVVTILAPGQSISSTLTVPALHQRGVYHTTATVIIFDTANAPVPGTILGPMTISAY